MIVSAGKVLAGSGMGPVGENSAAPRQGANDPNAGWKGGRTKVHSGAGSWAHREPEDHKRCEQDEIFNVDKIHWEKSFIHGNSCH